MKLNITSNLGSITSIPRRGAIWKICNIQFPGNYASSEGITDSINLTQEMWTRRNCLFGRPEMNSYPERFNRINRAHPSPIKTAVEISRSNRNLRVALAGITQKHIKAGRVLSRGSLRNPSFRGNPGAICVRTWRHRRELRARPKWLCLAVGTRFNSLFAEELASLALYCVIPRGINQPHDSSEERNLAELWDT